LGAISQVFERDEELESIAPGSRSMYLSYFELYGKDSSSPSNFSHLSAEVKEKIWEEVFHLKRLFLELEKPATVANRVKYPFSVEKRCALYRYHLESTGYGHHARQHNYLD
jgi:hypothetical protein